MLNVDGFSFGYPHKAGPVRGGFIHLEQHNDRQVMHQKRAQYQIA